MKRAADRAGEGRRIFDATAAGRYTGGEWIEAERAAPPERDSAPTTIAMDGETLMSVVKNGKTLLTCSDYVHFPEDGRRHEIIGGVHHVTPSPVTRHQRISRWIEFQLMEQIELPGHGVVMNAPMDVVLSDIDVVQPDILVILERNRRVVTPEHVRGAPDLVIEITLPTTQERDLDLKKSLYQARRVPEYWVARADEDRVEKFLLLGGCLPRRGELHRPHRVRRPRGGRRRPDEGLVTGAA